MRVTIEVSLTEIEMLEAWQRGINANRWNPTDATKRKVADIANRITQSAS